MDERGVLVVRVSGDDGETATRLDDDYTVMAEVDATAAAACIADGDRPGSVVVPAGADWPVVYEVAAGADPPVPLVLVADERDRTTATDVASAAEWVELTGRETVTAAVERSLETGQRLRSRRRASEQLASFFEHNPDPAIEYEYADGEPVVLAVNRAFEETFGFERDAVVGRPMNDVIVPPEKTEEAAELDERVAAGDEVTAELRRETADGQQAFLFKNIPVDGDADATDGYAIYVDISEQKERERRLQRQNERLNDFASVVTHDIRGPMGVMKNHLDIAVHTGDESHIAEAQAALDRMDELVGDLLELAKQGADLTGLESVSLAETAETAWRHVATGDATLTVAADAAIRADPGRLTQLLENLYLNAVKHNDDGVALTVGTTADGEGFYVADDGRGIPPEERNRVFKSGYTTDDGTGYGLTIVRQVARAHGWNVAITASDDGGARFEFRDVTFDS